MRLLLMCGSEVSEGGEVMEGCRRKLGEKEGQMKRRLCDANSLRISGYEKYIFIHLFLFLSP